jgi:hypothetical protein
MVENSVHHLLPGHVPARSVDQSRHFHRPCITMAVRVLKSTHNVYNVAVLVVDPRNRSNGVVPVEQTLPFYLVLEVNRAPCLDAMASYSSMLVECLKHCAWCRH